jgi:hypothetical protein
MLISFGEVDFLIQKSLRCDGVGNKTKDKEFFAFRKQFGFCFVGIYARDSFLNQF